MHEFGRMLLVLAVGFAAALIMFWWVVAILSYLIGS